MLTVTFSAYDLTSIRFAYSPLREVSAGVHALRTPAGRVLHLPWFKQVRPRLGGELAPLLDLVPGGPYIPDFLCPVPTSPTPDLAGELAVLRATPHEIIRTDLERMADETPGSLTGCAMELYREPDSGLERLVRTVEAYWRLAMAPHWPRMRNLLEGDLLYRARQFAEHGPAGVFADMHPAISWEDRALHLAERPEEWSRTLNGEGLLLAPSIFVWPKFLYRTDSPGQAAITYPARAIATLWERGSAPTPEALAAVIGRSRALLLGRLDSPASTTDLSRLTGLAPGSVSEQLTLLLSAGLVAKHRVGRAMLYVRTPRAQALLDS
ncbi:MAG: winged helix-turn-helix transcriptional regulator [Nonomuraea sp.]|nr:winged helix-turn-helix transcriptional regulator [Nonomuraea sp.]NUP83894.1 winged helix-turn-helix transcriptional regulator [Nonomuraea sp.]